MKSTDATSIVICGGGIIGCSIAYHLSLRTSRGITIIEQDEIGAAASGKAGGFLALDWSDDSPSQELARLSYALHQKLPHELQLEYQYRPVHTLALSSRKMKQKKCVMPDWIDKEIGNSQVLGTPDTTAQVHPKLLTEAFFKKATERGVRWHRGKVHGIQQQEGHITGVMVDGEIVCAETVVFAMGPWTNEVAQWLQAPALFTEKAYSVVLRPQVPVTPHVLFTDVPEIVPRPDGTIYVCGATDRTPLPSNAAEVEPSKEKAELLKAKCQQLSSVFENAKVECVQACYLPHSTDGVPIIGAIGTMKGAYIATGHSVWGILNAPATGLLMSELILDGKTTTLDISAFDPQRFFK